MVRAIRGAISVSENVPEAILESTTELLAEVIGRNELVTEDLISIIFTATPDLTAEFPAVAAREAGLTSIPLLCASEIPVPGSLGMCIRVMVHCTIPADRPIHHVYLREARTLRPDLGDAQ